MREALVILGCVGLGCSGAPAVSSPNAPSPPPRARYRGGDAPLSRAANATLIAIEAGSYIAGSTLEEREQAYRDYRDTAGHDAARTHGWFEREDDRHVADLPGFRIDQQLVTNAAYAEFVRDTGATPPSIDRDAWLAQGFQQDYDSQVARMNWRSNQPPEGREEHPVVLVTWDEASAYCAWRGDLAGEPRRLPTAAEYEKAARGEKGLIYPWGNQFEPDKLVSQVPAQASGQEAGHASGHASGQEAGHASGQEAGHASGQEAGHASGQEAGPGDTVVVGSHPEGASPYGMLDAAGNVFQWTATPWPHRKGTMTVKGSAWDDYAGVGRGASMHGRPARARHVIIGFRCAADGAHPAHRSAGD